MNISASLIIKNVNINLKVEIITIFILEIKVYSEYNKALGLLSDLIFLTFYQAPSPAGPILREASWACCLINNFPKGQRPY